MKFLRFVLPAIGLLLLGYLTGKLGLDTIVHNLVQIKWYFPAVLGLALLWHLTNSIAWRFAFLPEAPKPSLIQLFMAKLAGEAVNQLTPLANLGGEPLKAYLLKQCTPTTRGLASVVVNKTGQVLTGLFFTLVGFGLALWYWVLPLPQPIQIGMAALLGLATVLALILYRRQQHLFSWALAFAHRIGLKAGFLERRRDQATLIDANISNFYRSHKQRFFAVMFFHAIGWLLGVCETLVILRALGTDISFATAFLITALALIINALFFFMPSNIGVLEGGQVFLFMTLGLDPALGLSLGIVKRMRKIFWISVGWLFLSHMSRALAQSTTLYQTPSPPLKRPHPAHASYS